jgi:putative SOS response-associated peptidase YedK
MAAIHNRMPAILDDEAALRWLAGGPMSPEDLGVLTAPHAAEDMEAIVVSSLVNSPRNDVPECLEPSVMALPTPPPQQGELF